MDRVNATILSRTGSEVTMIPEVAKHLINSGGKRLRPILTIAMAKLVGYRAEGHVRLAAAVEFMHTATLLHDDVVDQSDMRRGKLAARMLWGNEASVLVGDFLLGQAFKMMVEVGSLRALEIPVLRRRGDRRRRGDAARRRQEHGHHRGRVSGGDPPKTAELFAAACEVGPVLGGRPKAEQAAAAVLRDESRHRVPASSTDAPRLRRQGRQARQECRRRFPRRQDHPAGGAGLSPRLRASANSGRRALERSETNEADSSTPSGS